MHAFASSPVHKFPLKFTSKDISVPHSLKRFIISMAVSLVFCPSASVMPVVWKQRVEVNISSGKSSIDIWVNAVFFLSYTTFGFLGCAPYS